MDDSTALVRRTSNAPVKLGERAKLALEVFGTTGNGLAALTSFVFPTSVSFGGGGYGTMGAWLSVPPRDFPYENVNSYNSSIVMACINWIAGGFREAEFAVFQQKDDGTRVVIPNHRLTKLLKRPNPFYSGAKMLSASLISYYLDGNAYWFKERSDGGFGSTRALYYIPHYLITPKAEQGEFISYYEYNVNGKSYRLPPDRVVHIRHELDPYNPMVGRKILDPVLSEIYTDEESAMFAAALIRNTGIPGVCIVPDTEKVKVTDEDAEAIKENFKRKFGGDNRGDPLVMNFAAKVFQMGFSPEQLQFREVRRLPEERVAAQFRVAPVVAGLGAGLDQSTYSNYEQAERHSYRSALIPAWGEFGEEITSQLLPEFTQGREEFVAEYDYTGVVALQESQDAVTERLSKLWEGDVIDRAEIRSATGFIVDETRDRVFYSDVHSGGLDAGEETPEKTPVKKALARARALLLLKAGEQEENLDLGFNYLLEADIKSAAGSMSQELEKLFLLIGLEAEKQVKQNLDRFSPDAEGERITSEVFKALDVPFALRVIWGELGEGLEDGAIKSVAMRIGEEFEAKQEKGAVSDTLTSIQNAAKSLLGKLVAAYEGSLFNQTRKAIAKAISAAGAGETQIQIAITVKQLVTGSELYPGIAKEAYDAAIAEGAGEASALLAGETKARLYRARLIAETEARTFQNNVALETMGAAGIDKVRVTDGTGCGWRNHDDIDKANGTTRNVSEAKRHALAHPLCKRRFYPPKKKP